MMNEAMNVLLGRRSIRSYRPEPLKKEDLDAIVKAGLYAPSAKNLQSTMLVAVQDADTIARLEELNCRILGTPDGHPFYGASTLVAVLSDSTYPNWIQDGALVMGNLMNAAESLGVASIWIHRAKEEFESDFGKKILADLGIRGEYEGIGHYALGYAVESAKEADARKENYVYYVR